jgi:HD-GYP domain-containing protein (c-di-GMP phosphodiesterase class II)
LHEKEQLTMDIVRALVSALDAKDPYTCGHSERVAAFARCIAETMMLDQEQVDRIYLSGLLHDIGKIGIDDSTLRHSGPLSEQQFNEIKKHPDGGWAILQGVLQMRSALPGVLYHHEQWDGQGYPDGLAGIEIPLDARILAVADAFDAMTSDRPYRSGMSHDRALKILTEGAGAHWDPQIIEDFLRAYPQIVRLQITLQPRLPVSRQPRSLNAVEA